ncbi:EI24 domain-containing protein [Egbenema bharatensis]|uniref:EI24 domain-containing protein n=1 Tax=Egbenema bharatensis TaxID=3463334 RepID=UPI003A8C1A5A
MNQQPISKFGKPIDRGLGSLIAGATYPLRALWLLVKTPRLRGYILMPILVNLILGVTLYAGLLYLGFGAIDALLANLPAWTAKVLHESPEPAALLNGVVALPAWSFALPDWHFPDWSLPDGFTHWHLPDWMSFPSWHISLPDWLTHWSIPLPTWLTDWHIQFPNWRLTVPNWIYNLPNWGFAVLIGLLRVVLVLILLLITGFIFLQFGVLLGSPWYGKLSEEIEKLKTGQMVLVEVPLPIEISRAVSYELKKLGLSIVIGIPLFLITLIVGVGTGIGTIGGISLASTIACMDFLDAAAERRRPSFRQKLNTVFNHLPASGSFGLVCLGLASIPFVNLLAIPICVAAGTLFFCDRILPREISPGEFNQTN